MLRFNEETVCFQEVPGEVSLAYTITGCPVGCKGCHSADTWAPGSGEPLTLEYFRRRLSDYQGLMSCVLFLGGEWHPAELIQCLREARQRNLNTCLYTGLDTVPLSIKKHLTFLKTGPWIAPLGGLDSPTTNQRFYDLRNQQLLNHLFITI
ncbi:MAG: anaerobic ribonucleoside-triphosphate reductase activating protein [Idiomarina sp.]|nr:anaerobic ribonucleoside-triphosphate reductase activating protein [Idiomarina sp.]